MAQKLQRWIDKVELELDSESEVVPFSASDTKTILPRGVDKPWFAPFNKVLLRHQIKLKSFEDSSTGSNDVWNSAENLRNWNLENLFLHSSVLFWRQEYPSV